jgi:PDZ domain-containing protein
VTTHPDTGKADDGRTVLGIVLGVDYKLPFTVKIDVGNVGGPSAGLMFSLGIYDKLTDGALTGGSVIAGTGTIDDKGSVGPIGGIAQKMVGAREGGATFFLAPADNCAEAAGREPSGLQVIKVSSFDDALAAVTAIGKGNTSGLPHC